MESLFGWMKTVAGFRRSNYVGLERTGLFRELVATAYNLVRMSNLTVEREAEVPVLGLVCRGRGAIFRRRSGL